MANKTWVKCTSFSGPNDVIGVSIKDCHAVEFKKLQCYEFKVKFGLSIGVQVHRSTFLNIEELKLRNFFQVGREHHVIENANGVEAMQIKESKDIYIKEFTVEHLESNGDIVTGLIVEGYSSKIQIDNFKIKHLKNTNPTLLTSLAVGVVVPGKNSLVNIDNLKVKDVQNEYAPKRACGTCSNSSALHIDKYKCNVDIQNLLCE